MSVVYSRATLFACRHVAAVSKFMFIDRLSECGLLRYRGSRGGRLTHLRAAARLIPKVNNDVEIPNLNRIPVIVGNNAAAGPSRTKRTRRVLADVIAQHIPSRRPSLLTAPSIYVLNAASLSKPGAVQQLAAELKSHGTSVAIITETHLKKKHTDSIVSISEYTLYRRDRPGRRGGGVAVYVSAELQSSRWTPTITADGDLEIDWVRIGDRAFVAALYHPPRPTYRPEVLLDFVEECVAEISHDFPLADVILAGDLNQLSDNDVIERTGLTQIVHQPTRGTSILDRVFVSTPDLYGTVRIATSVVRSDHKAVVAFADRCHPQPKTAVQRPYRRHTPAQHAQFLHCAASIDFSNPHPSASSDPAINTQNEFNHFYAVAHKLMEQFYPEQTVTLTSRDPSYITPAIKSMLRRKNKLMRAGRVEKAGALSARIGQAIQRRCRSQLGKYDGKTDSAAMWAAVREITGRQAASVRDDGITAETLNRHYAGVSTDPAYVKPDEKPTDGDTSPPQCISEWDMFRMLDSLRPTSAGLDGLPAWFLKIAAPIFCYHLSYLFNLSLSTSTVPLQWKEACIRPIPKIPSPRQPADFRPISVTPILTRLMERAIVRSFLYPAFQKPPPHLSFSDQFAFRPTGSTTAAIISLLHTVTSMLQTNPFVIVICLDFSKAFDTVRHSTLLTKMAELDLPIPVYNWLVSFFGGHTHRTVYDGNVSTTMSISASIVQGSSLGPASYAVTAADLKPLHADNRFVKFADDTYLVVPANSVHTRAVELDHIAAWATENNLTLNMSKTKEVIFHDSRRRHSAQSPSLLPGVARDSTLKVLGVTFSSHLSASDHIRRVISDSAQSLYALRVLRHHGLNDVGLQTVFRAVVVSRLMYASPAWRGFATATDLKRVDAFLRRCKRYGYCPSDLPDFEELLDESDDRLFSKTLNNSTHTLHTLLPPQTTASQHYHLRPRTHDRQLPTQISHLCTKNFVTRALYKDCY